MKNWIIYFLHKRLLGNISGLQLGWEMGRKGWVHGELGHPSDGHPLRSPVQIFMIFFTEGNKGNEGFRITDQIRHSREPLMFAYLRLCF